MMRGEIFKRWNTVTATLFSVVVIFGSYLLGHGIGSPQLAQASTETALLQAIAMKDSNGDGLPDWEKSLYGIPMNSTTTDYFNLGMTDGEAVAKGLIVPKAIADISVASSSPVSLSADGLPPPPAEGTLTSAFTQDFLTLYLTAKQTNGNTDLSESQITDIANQAVNQLSSSIQPVSDFKSAHDLTVSGSGADALKAFAVNAEAVFIRNTSTATTSELIYLKSALEHNDVVALSHIASIAKGYRDSAAGLSVLPVPTELSADDLILINAMMRLSGIISDFTRVNDDPLAAMLALQQYPKAVESLGTAFVNIDGTYAAASIILPPGTPGASFVNLVKEIASSPKTGTPKL
jgi:hypothetical protein